MNKFHVLGEQYSQKISRLSYLSAQQEIGENRDKKIKQSSGWRDSKFCNEYPKIAKVLAGSKRNQYSYNICWANMERQKQNENDNLQPNILIFFMIQNILYLI